MASFYDEKKSDFYRPRNGHSNNASGLSPERRRRATYILCLLVGAIVTFATINSFGGKKSSRPPWLIDRDNTTLHIPHVAFPPPEDVDYRAADSMDAFASYKYRNTCNISSLDLHLPFSPLCQSRQDMLNAMSWGGRIGHDAPYMPRGCDMRWFTSEEICDILGRFSKVVIVGDSMMRHIIGSLNVFMRKDLGYGAVTDWNFSPDERIQGIFKTQDVLSHDPQSFTCDPSKVNVMIEVIVRHPIPSDEIQRFKEEMAGPSKPDRPPAFIYGHGLWNDLDLQAHINWIDEIMAATTEALPYLNDPEALWPRLVVTPNAAGRNKPDEWLVSQGNKALSIYEDSVRIEDGRRGIEHLGTFNMSVQANMYDGG
ncbi:MAG: hypothetical protein Q9162_003374 [Coniocarpon cinnabarinum]